METHTVKTKLSSLIQLYKELKECLSYDNRKKYIDLTNKELISIIVVWLVLGIFIFSN